MHSEPWISPCLWGQLNNMIGARIRYVKVRIFERGLIELSVKLLQPTSSLNL